MASILTEQFRKNTADLLLADIQTSSYYIGIGKSDAWYEPLSPNTNAPLPHGTIDDTLNVQYALTDLIRVHANSNTAIAIPRVTLSPSQYKQYDRYDAACFYPSGSIKPCYFVDDDGNIYLFIKSKENVSVTSNYINNYNGQAGSPLLIWGSTHVAVYIGKTVDLSPFNNEQFVELNTDLDTTITAPYGYAGRVHGFHILDGGTYDLTNGTDIPATVTVRPKDVTSALTINATVNITNSTVTSIYIADDYWSSLSAHGLNSYDFTYGSTCSLTITDVNATVAATLAAMVSKNPFGYNVREYTPSWYVGFIVNSRVSAHDVYSGYAQVSLLKNPLSSTEYDNPALTSNTVNMKKSFTLASDSSITNSLKGYQITQSEVDQSERYIGVVDSVSVDPDTNDAIIYYNSSVKYGIDSPIEGSTVTFINGEDTLTSVAPLSNPTSPDFVYGSAQVIFIDNRATIQRSADQNEELKIIVQL